MKRLIVAALVMAVALLALSGAPRAEANAVTTQLGFLIDGSGSINSSDFDQMKAGIASEVETGGLIPGNGSVEITVVQFSTNLSAPCNENARVEVPPTIVTNANRDALATAINTIDQGDGGTPTAHGINCMYTEMVNSPNFPDATKSVINIATDGVPNEGNSSSGGNAQDDAEWESNAAVAAGIDEIDAECLPSWGNVCVEGSGLAEKVKALVQPQAQAHYAPPYDPAFVAILLDFSDLEEVMKAKIAAVIGCGEHPGVDTDGDCFKDFIEVILGSDPNDPLSTPEDSSLPETCADGVDNDRDGDIDGDDPGCPPPPDSDGDTTVDAEDNCPSVANDQTDTDGDGVGDACDIDDDNDGWPDFIEMMYGCDPADSGSTPPFCP